jgi:predicted transcriptional regulator
MTQPKHDPGLDVLLALDGVVLVVDPSGAHWVKVVVKQVAPSPERPRGISYSLTLHAADGERLVGYDDAHAVSAGSGPGRRARGARSSAPAWPDDALRLQRRGDAVAGFLERRRRRIARERSDPMKTLRIGVASMADMKARTMAVARGELKLGPDEPKLWFTSIESLARVLSDKNRLLLDLIIEQQPNSLAELETLSGRAKSNLSRTLKSMERFGLVELLKGEGGAVKPRVPYEEIKLDLPIGQYRGAPLATPAPV